VGRRKRGRVQGQWYTRQAEIPPEPPVVASQCPGSAPHFREEEERIQGLRGDAAILGYRNLAKHIAKYNKACEEEGPTATTHLREVTRCYPIDLATVCDKSTVKSIDDKVLWLSRHKTYCSDLLRTIIVTLYEEDAPVEHFTAILRNSSDVVSRHLFWPGDIYLPNTPDVPGLSDIVRRVRQDFLEARREYPVEFQWGLRSRAEFRESLKSVTSDLLGSLKAMLQQGYWLRCFDRFLCDIRSIGYETIKVKSEKSCLTNLLVVDPDGTLVCNMVQLRDAFKTGKATGEFAIDALVRESRQCSNVTSAMRWTGKIKQLTGAHLKQHLALNRSFVSEDSQHLTGLVVRSRENPSKRVTGSLRSTA